MNKKAHMKTLVVSMMLLGSDFALAAGFSVGARRTFEACASRLSAATLDEESPFYCDEIYNSRHEPARRLADIRTHLLYLEHDVRDLEALLTGLILDPSSRAEIQAVREELFRARAYEGELRTAEQFWQSIIKENKRAQKDTQDLYRSAFRLAKPVILPDPPPREDPF